jgi:hypothetical protein
VRSPACRETFPRATFEIGHLSDNVLRRKRRQIPRLIVAGADWQMTFLMALATSWAELKVATMSLSVISFSS